MIAFMWALFTAANVLVYIEFESPISLAAAVFGGLMTLVWAVMER